jgi:hypothetical protein
MRTAWLLLLCSCATISTSGMSDSCKNTYNACLNACPEAPRQGAVNPNLPDNHRIDPGIAACTAECNERAKKCK